MHRVADNLSPLCVPYRRIVGVRITRSQTELGALVIDADSRTPFHALVRKDRR